MVGFYQISADDTLATAGVASLCFATYASGEAHLAMLAVILPSFWRYIFSAFIQVVSIN